MKKDGLPLSVFMIACNEEERIGDALAACADLSDDIILVDSGSTDRTLEIAKNYTSRIYHRDWEGYGPQKLYGESLCKYDWILNLDADEILLPDVKNSIRAIFAKEEAPRAAAYSLRFYLVSRFAASYTPHRFAPVNITPRLYHKNKAGFKQDTLVHDKVIIKDGTREEVIEGAVAHVSFRSYTQMWEKIRDYAELQAEEKFSKGKKARAVQLLYEPLFFFLKYYFLRRMMFLGTEGAVISLSQAAGRALRTGMTLEKYHRAASKKR